MESIPIQFKKVKNTYNNKNNNKICFTLLLIP